MANQPFTVIAHGNLASDGTWSIEASVEFRDGPPPPGSDLMNQAALALRAAIAAEAEHGKALRATKS